MFCNSRKKLHFNIEVASELEQLFQDDVQDEVISGSVWSRKKIFFDFPGSMPLLNFIKC